MTALAEVFQKTRTVELSLDEPWLVSFEVSRDLPLLDTTGTWPLSAGGSMALNSGSRVDAQIWSREIYRQYAHVQGIFYPSSLLSTPCVALYERARDAMPSAPLLNRALKDLTLRTAIKIAASRINYAVVP